MAVASPQSSGLGTTAWTTVLKIAKDTRYVSYRGEIVDERDLCLCEVAHIRVADPKCVLAPPVDLGRGRSPENVIEKYISKTALSKCGKKNRVTNAYEDALNVGESTGGARKACGNCLVLKIPCKHF
jgi:hypothetical protein